MELKDRVAFVTAGGAGIGRAGALAMARAGALVVVTDLVAARAEAVAGEIRAAGGRAEGHVLDVSDDAALEAAILGTAQAHTAGWTCCIPMRACRCLGGWIRSARMRWTCPGG